MFCLIFYLLQKTLNAPFISCYCLFVRWFPSTVIISMHCIDFFLARPKSASLWDYRAHLFQFHSSCLWYTLGQAIPPTHLTWRRTYLYLGQLNTSSFIHKSSNGVGDGDALLLLSPASLCHNYRQGSRRYRGRSWQVQRNSSEQRFKSSWRGWTACAYCRICGHRRGARTCMLHT